MRYSCHCTSPLYDAEPDQEVSLSAGQIPERPARHDTGTADTIDLLPHAPR